MSKAVRFHERGGPDVLRIEDVDVPDPGAGQVRIRTRALGVNRAEAMFRSGRYLQAPILPAGLGYEAAGEVEGVGAGVDIPVGAAVSVVPAFTMNDFPVHGELVLAPARAVVQHPEWLSWEEAAATWMAFLTAYGGLVVKAGLRRGETVLVPAASSSVGLAAIQVANALGATPVAITRTAAKRDRLLAHGAGQVIVGAETAVGEAVLDITAGRGADVVFDPVAGPALHELCEACADGGRVVLYGALAPEDTTIPALAVLGKHLRLEGYELFEVTDDESGRGDAVRFVLDGLRSKALSPVVGRTFALVEVRAAHEYMESNEQFGKIVMTV